MRANGRTALCPSSARIRARMRRTSPTRPGRTSAHTVSATWCDIDHPLQRVGDAAELLHQLEPVEGDPDFGDLPIGDVEDVDAGDGDVVLGDPGSQQLLRVGPGPGEADRHTVAVDEHVVDVEVQVGEGLEEDAEELLDLR